MSPSTSKLNLRAFSLVEVVMAIGIVAMAFVPLLGLIPSGLHTFRESMDTAIGSQIAQKVIAEAIQTDFNTLVAEGDGTTNFTFLAKNPGDSNVPWRYFDDQGNELSTAPSDVNKALYHVLTRVAPKTPLPGAGPAVPDLENLAQVTVQVVKTPRNVAVAVVAQPANVTERQNTPLRNLVDPTQKLSTYTAVALVPRQ
jgi:uncharacterized protein (TIGR02598 family)